MESQDLLQETCAWPDGYGEEEGQGVSAELEDEAGDSDFMDLNFRPSWAQKNNQLVLGN